jgi:type IV pilus assembly protein PilC
MPKFRFVALDAQGRETEGILDAENQTRAISLIKEKGYFPTSVMQLGAGGGRADKRKEQGTGVQSEIKLPAFITDFLAGRVKAKQLMVLTRQMSVLLNAGVPLLRGLQILLKQEPHPTLRKGIGAIGESVEGGSTFAEALAQQPKIFTPFYVNMVRAGEAGGVLEEVLARLAEHMEKTERLKNRIKSAMVYPIVVLVISVVILVFMMVKIIPKFAEIFQGLLGSGQLPWLTRFVMNMSKLALTKGYWVIVLVVLLFAAWKLIRRNQKGAFILDTAKLRMPIFGNLIRLTAVAHFSRTLSTLLTSGVAILQALNIVADTTGNAVIAQGIKRIHDSVKEGESMALPMDESGAFPQMAISMVEVGEETGALPDMLGRVAVTYEDEVDTAVEGLTSIIEPIMIVFLAIIVGTIVIAMFLPLVTLVSQLGE